MNDCPCYQCICVAICRHKIYSKLVNCPNLFSYIYSSNSDNVNVTYGSRLEKVSEALEIPIFYLPGTKIISLSITFGNEKAKDFYD